MGAKILFFSLKWENKMRWMLILFLILDHNSLFPELNPLKDCATQRHK